MRSTFALLLLAVGCCALAGPIYTTSFEQPEFVPGPISPTGGPTQGGWSGGAQEGFTNNTSEPGSVYDEFIVNTEAHTGEQSWWFQRGYDSPGQGTPFTPALSPAAGEPSSGAAYNAFRASFWFKAANPDGDGSCVMIAGGNPAGTDRSSNYLEIENVPGGGVTVRTFEGVPGSGWDATEVVIATGLDASSWHSIEMIGRFYDGPYNDTWTYIVDGGSPITAGAYFETARNNFGFAYEMTNRLKFQPRHPDGNADPNVDPYYAGFYFDDIYTEVLNFPTPPVADPNGPYRILVGEGLTLDGSGSYDPDGGSIVEYLWSVGALSHDAGASAITNFTWADLGNYFGITGNGVYTIRLTVKDDEQQVAWAETTLTVVPEPATVCLFAGALAALAGARRKRRAR